MQPVSTIEGTVTFLDRENVDTDQLVPARFLKRIERSGFGEFLLYDWRRNGELDLVPNPVLVSGANFGCGSSREHAAWAIEDFGYRAVIAPSIADIFANNATKVGVLPIVLTRAACQAIVGVGAVRIDLAAQTVEAANHTWTFVIDPEIKHRLLNGLDDIAITLEKVEIIDAFEARYDPLTFSLPTTSL